MRTEALLPHFRTWTRTANLRQMYRQSRYRLGPARVNSPEVLDERAEAYRSSAGDRRPGDLQVPDHAQVLVAVGRLAKQGESPLAVLLAAAAQQRLGPGLSRIGLLDPVRQALGEGQRTLEVLFGGRPIAPGGGGHPDGALVEPKFK